MSADFIVRLIGMFVFAVLGFFFGASLGKEIHASPNPATLTIEQYAVTVAMLGALFGLIITPYFTTRPVRYVRSLLSRANVQTLFSSIIGLIIGLLTAALLSFPLSLLPYPFGAIMPFAGVLLCTSLGIALFVMRRNDIRVFLAALLSRPVLADSLDENRVSLNSRSILLDTSVIIDGRIADIARTGFLQGTLTIPHFVLAELQYIADSPDNIRRQRGRRGMEVLALLQKEPSIGTKMSDIDVEGVREVDDKLVILARQLHCPILTNDYNLNKIAELQGVNILNVNELANAVKSILLPGEPLSVRVIQEGKEANQGVGYMDDGTMVVVENGRDRINQVVPVTVTKVLQTAAGRMIFARPD